MASGIGNFIDRIQLGNDDANQIAIGSSAYAVCDTAANTAAKTANIPGFALNLGTTVHIKFTNANTAANPTLSINGSTAKPIVQYGTTAIGTDTEASGWQAGAVLTLTYDGTSWVKAQSLIVTSSAGDAYTPVYVNNGLPAITYPVQYTLWTINSGHTKVTFTGNGIFTADSYVIALVVTEGFDNLNGPLTWTTGTNSLVISTIATSGAVSGYVLTARGVPTGLSGVSSADTN